MLARPNPLPLALCAPPRLHPPLHPFAVGRGSRFSVPSAPAGDPPTARHRNRACCAPPPVIRLHAAPSPPMSVLRPQRPPRPPTAVGHASSAPRHRNGSILAPVPRTPARRQRPGEAPRAPAPSVLRTPAGARCAAPGSGGGPRLPARAGRVTPPRTSNHHRRFTGARAPPTQRHHSPPGPGACRPAPSPPSRFHPRSIDLRDRLRRPRGVRRVGRPARQDLHPRLRPNATTSMSLVPARAFQFRHRRRRPRVCRPGGRIAWPAGPPRVTTRQGVVRAVRSPAHGGRGPVPK